MATIKLNKTDRAMFDRLMRMLKKDPDNTTISGRLMDFAAAMDEKYGGHVKEITGFSKGGIAKKEKRIMKANKGGLTKRKKK